MSIIFSTAVNNVQTTLAANRSAGSTTMVVASVAGFPTLTGSGNYSFIRISSFSASTGSPTGIFAVTAINSQTNTLTLAASPLEGTTDLGGVVGDPVYLAMTAGYMLDAYNAIQSGSGSQGYQGYQGQVGQTGSSGQQGYQGQVGQTGSSGQQGYQGKTGSQGQTGGSGSQGYQGQTGGSGSQGYQGQTGVSGSQGYQGQTGGSGSQGYQGQTGGSTGTAGGVLVGSYPNPSGFQTQVNIPTSISTLTTDSDGSTVTFNLATSNRHFIQLGGNRIFALSNAVANQAFTIIVQQPSSGGPYTPTWFSGISWPSGTTPTLSTGNNARDTFVFIALTSSTFLGYIAGLNQ